ncbi:MAG: universal stress protein [Candidatus Cloacimonetes bacterium]|nr:universal stress protein [Candidatus Cloacimonadota bacterium]MCF7813880.1 universal stress protein [Candidatus Cloacimonadota bacterium]MCF7868909.1 universal stress protein [Candidatus Cloacimonadota bacterium]MCF7883992.1 universal stress protein [Candidatus Cloacimonadota bacterium]
MKKILVAIDFTEVTDRVIDFASKFALEFKAKLCILHSESFDYYIPVNEYDEFPQVLQLRESRLKAVKKRLKDLKANLKSNSLDVKSVLMEGPTTDNILSEAEKFKADLIIVGSHKHGKFYNLLFGSTHDELIKHSKFPVLVIPPVDK